MGSGESWLNTDFYQRTKEVIGVLPIPSDIQVSYGLSKFVESIHNSDDRSQSAKRPDRHLFLARLQGTRKAVLPVNTIAEKKLLQRLIQENDDFRPGSSGHPNWDSAVVVWNQYADTNDGVYYKVRAQFFNLEYSLLMRFLYSFRLI